MHSSERRLEALVVNPIESLDVEIKDWLKIDEPAHKADLAKAMLALANHGGGFILIGFRLTDGRYEPTHASQEVARLYDQDRINGIVARYADPPFHIECQLVQGATEKHPVIVVTGGHNVPIRCTRSGPDERHTKQNAYYIRRPGPASEEPQSAKEWSDLIRRCVASDKDSLLGSLRALLDPSIVESSASKTISSFHDTWISNAKERFLTLNTGKYGSIDKSPFVKGYWLGSFSFYPPIEGIVLSELNNKLPYIIGHETGWPIGLIMHRDGAVPYPYQGCVEAWLGNVFSQPDSADFWRVSPLGHFTTVRGYQEDTEKSKHISGSVLDFILLIWRVSEFLLYGYRYAKELNLNDVSMIVTFEWNGIKDRSLDTFSGNYFPPHNKLDRKSTRLNSSH